MIRGHVAARPCLRIGEDGVLIPDVTPLDTRFFAPELGRRGLSGVLPGFSRQKRSLNGYITSLGIRCPPSRAQTTKWWTCGTPKRMLSLWKRKRPEGSPTPTDTRRLYIQSSMQVRCSTARTLWSTRAKAYCGLTVNSGRKRTGRRPFYRL